MPSWRGFKTKGLAMGLLVFLLPGCRSILAPDVYYSPVLPIDNPPPPKSRGTIYQAGYNVRLYGDYIATRVGDVITVRLEEATKGEYRGITKTQKDTVNNFPMPIFFGKPVPAMVVQTNTNQSFDGKGNSDQSNKLNGTISVTVMRVLANHNLMIQGESWVSINEGTEFIQLTGIIRPADIQPNNTISSQRIAAAQIKYGARGAAGYATKSGLMAQLFNRYAPY